MLVKLEAGGLQSELLCPELKLGCLHCSLDTGTDSGSVHKEREGGKREKRLFMWLRHWTIVWKRLYR